MHLQYFIINTNEINKMAVQPLPRRQRDYHEIMWLTNGTAEFIIDGDQFRVNANSFFIFPKGRTHQFLPNKQVEGHVIRFWRDLIDEFPRLLFSKFTDALKIKIDKVKIKRFEWFFELFHDALNSSSKPTPVIMVKR
ncbi:MAG: cupin domain-containing protein [Aureispira sp.]